MIAEEGEASNVEDLLRNVSGSQLSGVGEEEKTQPEHEEQEGLEREAGQLTREDAVDPRPHQLTAETSGRSEQQLEDVSAVEKSDHQPTAQKTSDPIIVSQQQNASAEGTSTNILPENVRRSRPRVKIPRYLRYHGRDIERLQTVSEDDLHRVIELLKTPVAARNR